MGYMIVATEVAKYQSIGTLIRCACAFGAKEVVIIGSLSYSTYGAHGAQKYMTVKHFYTWMEAMNYVQVTCDCEVIGISTVTSESSVPIFCMDYKTKPNVCFVVTSSNKVHLSPEIKVFCDKIVHVPFPNTNEESSVHIDSKTSICLQHYSSSASFLPTPFLDGKYATSTPVFVGNKPIKIENNSSVNNSSNSGLGRYEFDFDETSFNLFSLSSDGNDEQQED
jgi:hypothetical protein